MDSLLPCLLGRAGFWWSGGVLSCLFARIGISCLVRSAAGWIAGLLALYAREVGWIRWRSILCARKVACRRVGDRLSAHGRFFVCASEIACIRGDLDRSCVVATVTIPCTCALGDVILALFV